MLSLFVYCWLLPLFFALFFVVVVVCFFRFFVVFFLGGGGVFLGTCFAMQYFVVLSSFAMGRSRGEGGRGSVIPLKSHKHIGFHSNTGPDPLENHKATKPAFNVGPSSARKRNAI